MDEFQCSICNKQTYMLFYCIVGDNFNWCNTSTQWESADHWECPMLIHMTWKREKVKYCWRWKHFRRTISYVLILCLVDRASRYKCAMKNQHDAQLIFNWINQQDAETSQVYYLLFKYSSTCFGHPHAHHQELQQLQ